ncbi:MAG: CotH kinase family protein [Polyangiaceae bacterium]
MRIERALLLMALAGACSGNERTETPAAGGGSGGRQGGSAGGVDVGSGGSALGGAAAGGAVVGAEGGALVNAAGAGGATDAGASGAGQGGLGPIVDPSDELFAPERLPRFDLELPPESLAALNAVVNGLDPKAEDYVSGTLRYGDETIANIGVRFKGEASFRKLDKKSAFKLKFDEFVAKQSFHGLRRLTLNNMVEDPSFLAERLAYEVFRAAGLPAPRCNNATVYVNGEFFGVYANVEAEDKTFLSRWFASNDGNLYEEGGVDFTPGAETSFDLETNEALDDRSGLVALIDAVQAAQPSDLVQTLDAKLDVARFLRFSAAEAAVNQWDMYAYTVFYPNNFRIYEDPDTARFVFLPWGMDMSMKPFRDTGRAHIPVFGVAQLDNRANGKVTAGLLFRKCLDSAECKAAYAAQVSELAQIYEQSRLGERAASYYEQIKEQVYLDTRKEYTNERFEAAYSVLQKTITERPAALRADLD